MVLLELLARSKYQAGALWPWLQPLPSASQPAGGQPAGSRGRQSGQVPSCVGACFLQARLSSSVLERRMWIMPRTNTQARERAEKQLGKEWEAAREEKELGVPQTRTLALSSTACCRGRRVQYLGIFDQMEQLEGEKPQSHGPLSWTPGRVKPEVRSTGLSWNPSPLSHSSFRSSDGEALSVQTPCACLRVSAPNSVS